ncbi:diguanylate cyclase [Pseudomonas entomophila]|uniref:GGDEF domain-containing protein n=1 Tax=Pseudomonas entomophila TaxID=312306 RepID=UPI0015E43046|nr:GGDEF domain-containing protein [Pseudomonas entomophila]MBA1191525.1 diguanylate cyclase [Pseudomonas entomophila]
MTDDAQRWKDKYLESLEQQEALERRWEARLDLLRRGLVRSTLAAEGSDKAVDACMKEMREVIRGDNLDTALAGLIPRLEKAVLDSEQRRETRLGQVSTALSTLVQQLQHLPLPSEVGKPLKKFARQLDERVGQAREMPLLLSELSNLQGRALQAVRTQAPPTGPGLLQRLFGARDSDTPATAPAASAPAPEAQSAPVPDAAPASIDPPAMDPPASAAPVADDVRPVLEPPAADGMPAAPVPPEAVPAPPVPSVAPLSALPSAQPPAMPAAVGEALSNEPLDDGPYALPYAVEPPYSSVAAHIEQTLLGLLDDLTLPERHKTQALAMRERVASGLNWYELIPVLDDLAVLMLAINDSGQHEFEAYLQQLNGRLESFQNHLQAASSGHADQRSASRQLDHQLRAQVGGLQSSVQDVADLASVRSILDNRLEGLLTTLDEHCRARDQREQALAGRLQGLAERVAAMEQEALDVRGHLEEQRQKALVDPLTGLPNRAAWSERLDHDVQAWQASAEPLCLAILDLDHFKRINDSYGHLAGDKVLKIVTNVMRTRLRGRDFIARFGDEEFVLLLPGSALAAGRALSDDLRAAVEACPFHFKGERVTVTVSIGVSAFQIGDQAETVLKRADQALYRAKAQGRNRVETDP